MLEMLRRGCHQNQANRSCSGAAFSTAAPAAFQIEPSRTAGARPEGQSASALDESPEGEHP